ncbi:MAG: family 20 glycosylhydrolase, partial [Phycisphaerae bacterium]|nr:family 20 glycosylhydrolase [Phycisphaerae bacterium]
CTGGPFKVSTSWGIFPDVYCAGNDQTIRFLEDVLTEVLELFPSEFIHVGGDECPKTRWKECAKCQARIKAEGLADEHELQSWVIRHFDRFLAERGRRLVGWDEILEGGLAPGATVQSWRGMKGAEATAASGHDVICSPTSNCYLDYAQARLPGEPIWMGYLPLERCYSFDPTPPEFTPEQAAHVLGVEGNIWTEHAAQERIDWQVFPRLCAIAEIGWTPESHRDFAQFKQRLETHYGRLDALGVDYFIAPPTCHAESVFDPNGVQVGELDSPCNRRFEFNTDAASAALAVNTQHGQVRYTLDGSEPAPTSPVYADPIRITGSTVIKARTFLPTDRGSMTAEFRFRKLAPIAAADVPNAQPGLGYSYYEGQWKVLPDFSKLTPLATGVAKIADTTVRQRDTQHALLFTGYVKVPADGLYTFHVTSDDGCRMWVHDELVVEHDGLHRATEESGRITLKAGLHPVKIEYFQAGGHTKLSIAYEGPGVDKHEIPTEAWWH